MATLTTNHSVRGMSASEVEDVRNVVEPRETLLVVDGLTGQVAVEVAEEFDAMCEPSVYDNPPADAWRRIGGLNRLNDPQLAVLQALAQWREQRAQDRDLPVARRGRIRNGGVELGGEAAVVEIAGPGIGAAQIEA